jgi:hypothetical protein
MDTTKVGRSRKTQERAGDQLKPSDYMSFVALLISVATATYNLVGWFEGPTITFRPPQLVSFHCYPATKKNEGVECDQESNVMLAGTSMTYVNSGRPEYGGILLDEAAAIHISTRSEATLHWQEFSNLATLGTGNFTLASATMIPGSSSIAHETRFFARDEPCIAPCNPRSNFVRWSDFAAAAADPANRISVTFSTRVATPNERMLTGTCDVFIDEVDRAQFHQLGIKKTNITSLTCVERK